jgi:membrane protein DedA with SNARE-associated domain
MITEIIDTVSVWIIAYGYAGLFLAMVVETIFPPIPSEVILPLAGYAVLNNHGSIFDAILAGIIGASGATIGSIAIYLVVRKVGRFGIIKYGRYMLLDEKKLSKVEDCLKSMAPKQSFLQEWRLVCGRLFPSLQV